MKILIGSPIKQEPEILTVFLQSVSQLYSGDYTLDYFFIDDNNDKSTLILDNFRGKHPKTKIIKSEESPSSYSRHGWDDSLIARVSSLKNSIICEALKFSYDYLFLVDSDLILHKNTILRLLSLKKDIVSNVFWTKTSRWSDFEPQVWLMDQGSFFDPRDRRAGSKVFRTGEKYDFFNKLKSPGTYPVGGLGACTLIHRKVLEAGVNFSSIYNISFWGEDRSFCIRAAAAGFKLYVDTMYPAFHIYRPEYLMGVEEYLNNGFNFIDYDSNYTLNERIKSCIEKIKRAYRLKVYDILYHKDAK